MSWITVIWSAVASACLTLAAIQLLIWCKKRTAWADLLFALMAIATAAMGICELWMMRAQTPQQFGAAVRWAHLPAWGILVALVWFVRLYLRAGRLWLGWTIIALRTAALLLNFLFAPNINYRAVTRLWPVSFLGERVFVAEGVLNPWMLIGQVGLLLLIIYAVDAAITVWRRGDRRAAVVVGGSISLFLVTATAQGMLLRWGVIYTPQTTSLFFVAIVAAMGYEMSLEALRAGQLLDELRESEERMRLAAHAAGFGLWVWDIGSDRIWGSKRWLELFGFAPDATVTFDGIIERTHPQDRQMVQREVKRALADLRDYAGQFRVSLPGGAERWISARGRVYQGANGESARMLGAAIDVTEAKRVEETIRASEAFSQTVLASLRNHIAILDRSGTIVAVNDAWSEYAKGNAPASPGGSAGVGVDYLAVCRRAAEAGDNSALRALDGIQGVLGGTSESFEFEYPCDSPSESRWFAMRVLSLKRPEGGVVISHTDITQRKRIELALAESELRYRTLFDAAPEGIILIGADGNVRAANAAQAQLYGYDSPRQLIGLYAPLFVAEKDRGQASRNMRDVLRGEQRRERQYTVVRRDGSEFIAEVTSATLRGSNGEVEGYLCLTRDITAAVRAQEALRQSDERFRQVADIAGEFIWEVDSEGLYTYASPSVERILGYSAEELVGKKHLYDLFEPSGREELKAAVFRIISAGEAFRDLPNVNLSRDGRVVHFLASGAPVRDAEGSCIGYRGANTDVTARIATEIEIEQHRNELAHLSRVAMLGELSGALAHELNQPLTAIVSNAQAALWIMSEQSVDMGEVQATLKDIMEDGKRAGEVIRRLRLLLKKGAPQRAALDINELVTDVLRLVRSDLLKQNVVVQAELQPGLPAVKGDRVQLQQVLLNLLINGCDAMSDLQTFHRKLGVRTEARDGLVSVSVIDRGRGIKPDEMDRLFEPFFTTKPHGMGLGLSVCRTIVAAHGGRLWASNNADRGASFHFTVPISRPAEAIGFDVVGGAAASTAAAHPKPAPTGARCGNPAPPVQPGAGAAG